MHVCGFISVSVHAHLNVLFTVDSVRMCAFSFFSWPFAHMHMHMHMPPYCLKLLVLKLLSDVCGWLRQGSQGSAPLPSISLISSWTGNILPGTQRHGRGYQFQLSVCAVTHTHITTYCQMHITTQGCWLISARTLHVENIGGEGRGEGGKGIENVCL